MDDFGKDKTGSSERGAGKSFPNVPGTRDEDLSDFFQILKSTAGDE
jgi:hypothetical protein